MTDCARLRPLIGDSLMDVAATLNAALKHLDNMDVGGSVRITVATGAEPQKWDIDLHSKQCAPAKKTKNQEREPGIDLELIMSETTWLEIAMGRLAPLEAFGAGRLRLRGDAGLANKLYERLKGDAGGVTSVCK